jgi:hypothetical protein
MNESDESGEHRDNNNKKFLLFFNNLLTCRNKSKLQYETHIKDTIEIYFQPEIVSE